MPTPDAQCLGPHQFRYALLPYQHDPLTAGLPHLADAFDTPLLVRPARAKVGKWPPSMSLLSIEPESLQLTALKCDESGNQLVLRFYNTSQTLTGHIRFGLPVAQVWRATAGEEVTGELKISPDGKHCQLEVAAGEIVTLMCRLDRK